MLVLAHDAPPPIAQMPDWHFWSRDLIGATPEDRALCDRGELSQQRMEELATIGAVAREMLAKMPVPNFNEWVPRRAVN